MDKYFIDYFDRLPREKWLKKKVVYRHFIICNKSVNRYISSRVISRKVREYCKINNLQFGKTPVKFIIGGKPKSSQNV